MFEYLLFYDILYHQHFTEHNILIFSRRRHFHDSLLSRARCAISPGRLADFSPTPPPRRVARRTARRFHGSSSWRLGLSLERAAFELPPPALKCFIILPIAQAELYSSQSASASRLWADSFISFHSFFKELVFSAFMSVTFRLVFMDIRAFHRPLAAYNSC